jgi:hypothetical protein
MLSAEHPGDRLHLSLYGKRIMLMEDDDRLYGAIRDMLEDYGCEILGSCFRISGPLDTLPRSHLDAALLDLERVSAARSSALVGRLQARGVPIVLITHEAREHLPRTLQACGRLLKPFSGEEMLRGLAGAIEAANPVVGA